MPNDNGIKIIGDIPIYVAYDSADVWSHPELFQMDNVGKSLQLLQVVHRMDFLQQDSFGEIPYTSGNIISRLIMIGG